MAYRLPVVIATISAIFSGISMGIVLAFPNHGDIAEIQSENCRPDVHHVVLVNETNGSIIRCVKCFKDCGLGHGFSLPCKGEHVTKFELDHICVACVAGVNYSNGDTLQCQPCRPNFCLDGQITKGKCEPEGDKRSCEYCPKNWYFNKTMEACQPCSCKNGTAEMIQICRDIGYAVNCDVNEMTATTKSPGHSGSNVWKESHTVIVACILALLVFLYVCAVVWRYFKYRRGHEGCSKKWLCQLFLFKTPTRSRPPSYTVEDRHPVNNGNFAGRGNHYIRQTSCPVTQDELYYVSQGCNGTTRPFDNQEGAKLVEIPTKECLKEKLTFFDMNNESCRQICQALKHNTETGMGFPTLAGYMGFSAKQARSFKETDDYCNSMFECWSNLDLKENTVLKLRTLVEELKRHDILTIIDGELQEQEKKCRCVKCRS